ncbi:hypothetical protein DYI37_12075 [Fulvimarina endophytica]|uniref:Uncharacterized protein n=1 Tax=Fulvimarina endophytica TaxID=2293836 RepID=A0A371X3C0_9HYPH|nr:glycosyltransferase [Fulvimarina endophytica]RFC63728.1 hypothetical protein DYI37_12075 [Fulvimarina endophytica]
MIVEDLDTIRARLDSDVDRLHPFMRRVLAHQNMGEADLVKYFRTVTDHARELALNPPSATQFAGEEVREIHKIWLTNLSSPAEPPAHYIDAYTEYARKYSADGWRFTLWVQDESAIKSVCDGIRSSEVPLDIKVISQHLSAGQWLDSFNKFIEDRKFPFAADILRMKILHTFGGIYMDLGAFLTDLNVMKFVTANFDYGLIYWENLFFQNSLMYMRKGNPVGSAFLELADDPYLMPKSLVDPLDALTEGEIFSGLGVTIILLTLSKSHARTFPFLANGNLVSWSSQQSWYFNENGQRGRFGNTYVPESKPSILTEDGWDRKSTTIFDVVNTG